MSELQAINSVFNIEIEKIDPNPDQPRKHFQEDALRDLAESIRRYGVMQPITVVRREQETSEGGLATRYEIVAGERRWRASVIAGMSTIPAIIREVEETEQDRFELSILENLQREDLNPVDKARSFQRLSDEFGMRHAEIADRLGKSREYVTNSMRLLELPDNILDALAGGEISEGHTRPMLTLRGHPDELQVLFNEIKTKHLTVRQAEQVAKNIMSKGKGAKRSAGSSHHPQEQALDPEMQDLQEKLSHSLGTSVSIDKRDKGGKLTIDFFSRSDLQKLLDLVGADKEQARALVEEESATGGHEEPALRATPPSHGHQQVAGPETPENDKVTSSNQAKPLYGSDAPGEGISTTQVSDSALAADFIGGGREVNSDALPDLEGDFDITTQPGAINLDESLSHREVNQVAAHEAPEARSLEGSKQAAADNSHQQGVGGHETSSAAQHQEEIDAIIKEQSSPVDLRDGTNRVSVDLGEMNFTQAEYNQDVINQANNKDEALGAELSAENINTIQQEQHTDIDQQQEQRRYNTQSHQVTQASGDFIPQSPAQEAVSTLDSPVQTGKEFVPQDEQATSDTNHRSSVEGVSQGVEFTMGGLGSAPSAASADQSHQADGQPTESSRGNNQTPEQSPHPDSTRSHEKYPQGDPYRLDNFSI